MVAEEILDLDDDMADYATGRAVNSQTELQKLREQVETVTQKMKGKHEDFLDYEAMVFEEQLLPQSKMPDIAKFGGNGDPRVHLRQYVSLMSSTGPSKRQVLRMFGMSLEGAPVVWYYGLEKKTKDDWRALAEAFLNQYVTDLDIDLSLRDLENMKQKPDESFKEYVDRWRGQLLKMQTGPSENEQIKIIIKGTETSIYNKLRRMTSMISNFRQLRETIMDIEEEEAENRKFHGKNRKATEGPLGMKVDATEIIAIRERRFLKLGKHLSRVFEKLQKQGLLEPMEPKPSSKLIPRHINLDRYCHFHPQHGHDTDNCTCLKHEIQDLIDTGKVLDPEGSHPSINRNSLPDRHVVPPPAYI